jgi:hypothetical protein
MRCFATLNSHFGRRIKINLFKYLIFICILCYSHFIIFPSLRSLKSLTIRADSKFSITYISIYYNENGGHKTRKGLSLSVVCHLLLCFWYFSRFLHSLLALFMILMLKSTLSISTIAQEPNEANAKARERFQIALFV